MYGELVPVGGGDNIPLLKEELFVGRREDCDIVLRFSNISSKHCKLVLSQGYWYVQDLNSTNGIKVNGVRVTDRRLDPGVRVSISKHDYTINYNPLKLGAQGTPPPDMLDYDILGKSLLERAGLQGMAASQKLVKPKPQPKEIVFDYSKLTLEDIKFEK
ncbi:MAG: FHA domain-containing protein [Planctomycetaceae bacterium]|jgi:adenylate cyclase|nr:FHA domain-containing protein [Planctomycetaceae bacterium]